MKELTEREGNGDGRDKGKTREEGRRGQGELDDANWTFENTRKKE